MLNGRLRLPQDILEKAQAISEDGSYLRHFMVYNHYVFWVVDNNTVGRFWELDEFIDWALTKLSLTKKFSNVPRNESLIHRFKRSILFANEKNPLYTPAHFHIYTETKEEYIPNHPDAVEIQQYLHVSANNEFKIGDPSILYYNTFKDLDGKKLTDIVTYFGLTQPCMDTYISCRALLDAESFVDENRSFNSYHKDNALLTLYSIAYPSKIATLLGGKIIQDPKEQLLIPSYALSKASLRVVEKFDIFYDIELTTDYGFTLYLSNGAIA